MFCRLVIAIVILAATSAKAEDQRYAMVLNMLLSCNRAAEIKPRAEWIEQMKILHGETLVATAYLAPLAIVDLLINGETDTWTILRSNPRKQACVAAFGKFPLRSAEPLV